MEWRRTADERLTPEAAEFVRFCYRRRPVGWPELYDEMCAVAGRGLFRGWGPSELAEQGIGFSLFETASLAALVARVVAEEQAGRPRPTGRVTRPVGAPELVADRGRDAERSVASTIGVPRKLAGAAAH